MPPIPPRSLAPHDEAAPAFGLPRCLRVPVAAASTAALTQYVGEIAGTIANRKGQPMALKVRPFRRGLPAEQFAPLWKTKRAEVAAQILFPEFQVWVHVDYHGYRSAYARFGMPPITAATFLDHIQNRRAMRLRWYSHPYLRLCPVSRGTNTSSGHATGGEGMEVEFLRTVIADPEKTARLRAEVSAYQVQYADPADLTKMLDVAPGTFVLDGVRDTQYLFYP
jgi:hypothetical protein